MVSAAGDSCFAHVQAVAAERLRPPWTVTGTGELYALSIDGDTRSRQAPGRRRAGAHGGRAAAARRQPRGAARRLLRCGCGVRRGGRSGRTAVRARAARAAHVQR